MSVPLVYIWSDSCIWHTEIVDVQLNHFSLFWCLRVHNSEVFSWNRSTVCSFRTSQGWWTQNTVTLIIDEFLKVFHSSIADWKGSLISRIYPVLKVTWKDLATATLTELWPCVRIAKLLLTLIIGSRKMRIAQKFNRLAAIVTTILLLMALIVHTPSTDHDFALWISKVHYDVILNSLTPSRWLVG